MINADSDLAPPARLAIAYAAPPHREALGLMLRFDARIADMVLATSEPLIAQMKLAWWREAIGSDANARPKGEVMLASLTALGDPSVDAAFQQTLDAWELLLVNEEWRTDTLDSFAKLRGGAIFPTYAMWTGVSDQGLADMGAQWAIDDLQARTGKPPMGIGRRPDMNLPRNRQLRPLTILALSFRTASGPALLWHALTGR